MISNQHFTEVALVSLSCMYWYRVLKLILYYFFFKLRTQAYSILSGFFYGSNETQVMPRLVSFRVAKCEIQKPSTCRVILFHCKSRVEVLRFSPCAINLLHNKNICWLKKVVAKRRATNFGFVKTLFSSNSQLVMQQICSCCETSWRFFYRSFSHDTCLNFLKSKTKEPQKVLSSSGIRDGKFISVCNFKA